jgi:hypothetical protein
MATSAATETGGVALVVSRTGSRTSIAWGKSLMARKGRKDIHRAGVKRAGGGSRKSGGEDDGTDNNRGER